MKTVFRSRSSASLSSTSNNMAVNEEEINPKFYEENWILGNTKSSTRSNLPKNQILNGLGKLITLSKSKKEIVI